MKQLRDDVVAWTIVLVMLTFIILMIVQMAHTLTAPREPANCNDTVRLFNSDTKQYDKVCEVIIEKGIK